MKKASIKLTPVQIDYLAKYMTATNLAVDPRTVTIKPEDGLCRYIDALYHNCASDHDCEDIDITPEYRSFVKEVKKDPTYWVKQFEKDFGEGSLALLPGGRHEPS